MSALVINNFPQFFDADGSPLDNGSIYFGLVNQNPETNPIQVYWDADLTQPAAQPIKTLNGYISRAGTPARLFVNQNYSINVRNRKRELVYYSANFSMFVDSSSIQINIPSVAALQSMKSAQIPSGYAWLISYNDGQNEGGGPIARLAVPVVPDNVRTFNTIDGVSFKRMTDTVTPEMAGAKHDGSNDYAALQALFSSGGDMAIPSNSYLCNSPLLATSAVKSINWLGKITTTYPGIQDTAVHPILHFSGFSGVITGEMSIEHLSPSANNACDGVQFEICSGFYVESFNVKGTRFGLIPTTCTDYYFGVVNGETMRGWQGGSPDNGGSIVTMTGNETGNFGSITGTNIYKAGLYFSIDGVSGDNKNITVGDVDLEMAASPVANAIAFRSASNVTIGSLRSTGGIAGIYISREESAYTVDNVTVGKVTVTGNSVASSNSNSVYIHSFSSSFPVGKVEIGEVNASGAFQNSLFVDHCRVLQIGSLTGRAPSARNVVCGGSMDSLEIGYMDLGGAVGSNEILINTPASIKNLKFGTVVIQDRGVNAGVPISFVQGTVLEWTIGSIIDRTAAPAYAVIATFGATLPNTIIFSIGFVSTLAISGALSVRGDVINTVRNWKLFTAARPVGANWPVGTTIFKQTPTGSPQFSWAQTSLGWKSTGVVQAVSADKGDAAATLNAATSESTSVWNTPLTAPRAVTLQTTTVGDGEILTILRTAAATGASALNVGTGPLKALAVGQGCDVQFNGTAWILLRFWSL